MQQKISIFTLLLMALTTMPFSAFAALPDGIYLDKWMYDRFCNNKAGHGMNCGEPDHVFTCSFRKDLSQTDWAVINKINELLRIGCEEGNTTIFSNIDGVYVSTINITGVSCEPGYMHPSNVEYSTYRCVKDPNYSEPKLSAADKAALEQERKFQASGMLADTPKSEPANFQEFLNTPYDMNTNEQCNIKGSVKVFDCKKGETPISCIKRKNVTENDLPIIYQCFKTRYELLGSMKSMHDSTMPSLSKKPSTSSPKPTSAKAGGAGAGAAKVVKAPPKPTTNNNNNVYTAQENKLPAEANTAAASSAVAAPYAAVNSTVAKAPLEHIDPLKANINTPKPEAVSAEFTKKDVEKLYTNLPEEQEAKKACEKKEKGKWVVNGKTSTCVCPNQADGYFFDKNILKCINQDNSEEVAQSILDSIPSLTPGDSITVKKSLMNTSDIRSAITQWESKCREVATSRKYMGAEANIQNNNKSPNSTITCLIQSCKKPEMYQLNSSKTACEQPSMSGEQASQNNCLAEGGEWKTKEKTCNCKGGRVWKPDTQTCVTEQMSDDEKQMIANCDGTWDSSKKICNCHADKMAWSKSHQSCIDINDVDVSEIPQNKCGTVLPDTGWDSSTGVCVKLNENGCVGNDKKCNKSATKAQTKLEKSMEKDINTLTKAFFDTVKKIVKACEKDNGSFKDGECIQKPTEEQPAETNNTNNKRTSGAKAGKGKKK